MIPGAVGALMSRTARDGHGEPPLPSLGDPGPEIFAGPERADAAELALRLEAQAEMIGALAGAIGACAACFGTDPGCPDCDGHGAPGALRPEPGSFELFVAPVIRRMGPTGSGTSHPGKGEAAAT